MSYAYASNTGPSPLPSFTSGASSSPQYSAGRPWNQLSGVAIEWVQARVAAWETERQQGRGDLRTIASWGWKRLFKVANAIILVWIFTLHWGERTAFQESINACVWESWERWPQGATPHHVAFIADPQLVDPHTYPGRPWPLSTLTVKYTDQYLRRSFASIQESLNPDSVLFLGDLFDGGREWATGKTSSPEKQYQKYTDSFWKKEYGRFMRIFLEPWPNRQSEVENRGRRMIASLPGNHDLGFGNGIQRAVRDRFQAYFGRGNRVDVLGNHTFVSVDTPSLSAMDQPDPVTGSSSTSLGPDGDELPPLPAIWKEAGDFLDKMPTERARAETEELRALRNQSEDLQFQYRIAGAGENTIFDKPVPQPVGFPTILLTHVPLYRKAATPCGPLREHYPPSSDQDLEEDEQNALKIAGGYQYQNVLTQTVSNEIVTKAGPNIVQVYSGDDHDYCEVSHREFNGSPNEITVKSISWAMGVRHPGFVLTSLWNPIDPETGKPTQKGSAPTIQNHLCLLPDQLGIFIHYGCILILSIAVLLINSICRVSFISEPNPSNGSILPLSELPNKPRHRYQSSGTSSSTLSSPGGRNGISTLTRNPAAKPFYDTYRGPDRDDTGSSESKDKTSYRPARPRGLQQKLVFIGKDLYRSMKSVAWVVLPVYFFLIWRW